MSDKLLTDAELAEIEARANAATAGPWWHDTGTPYGAVVAKCDCPDGKCNRCDGYDGFLIGESILPSNRPLIAACRTDVPALVAALRFARETIRDTLADTGEWPFYDMAHIRKMAKDTDEENDYRARQCRDILRALGEDEMLNYTGSGGIFVVLGKLIKKVNAYYALGNATYPADENEIATAMAAGNWNDLISPLPGYFSNGQSTIATLRQNLAQLANNRLLENDVVTGLGITQSNIANVLSALIPQMVTDAQSVQQNNVTIGSVTPGGSNVGSGTVLISPILDGVTAPARFAAAQPAYNGLSSQLPIAETMTLTCTQDSYSGGVTPGQEQFQITGPLGQSNVWGVGTEGTGLGPSIKTLQAGTLLQNASFTGTTGQIPTSWTLASPATVANCQVDATTFFLGGSSVALIGDGATATIQLTQVPGKLTPLKRYCFIMAYQASLVATGSQNLLIQFTGTGYTAASTEKISIPGNSWATTWALAYFFVNIPATLPSNFTLSISLTGTVPSGTKVWLDTIGFDVTNFENGLGFVMSTGATPFVKGDSFSAAIGNDYGGAFQTFARRQLGIQLPSSGSPTIANSLAT